MPVNLSIKNVPDDLAERLRERARRNHRSIQGELLTILEEAVRPKGITVGELRRRVKELDLPKGGPSSAEIIRGERDAR
jgi:plasmid stability protein